MKKIKLVVVFLIVVSNITSCSLKRNESDESYIIKDIVNLPNAEEKAVINVVETYYELLLSGDLDATQEYLDKYYNYLNKSLFEINDLEVAKKLFSLFSMKVEEVELEENYAVVKLEVTHPDAYELLQDMMGAFSFGMSDDAYTNAINEKLEDETLTKKTDTAYIALKKKQNNWEIITDESFDSLIWYGLSPETNILSVTENELKLNLIEEYKGNILIEDYIVEMCDKYSGEVPGIKNVSIKNNGDKQIDTLELNLDFLKDDGSVYVTKEVEIFGIFDNGLKLGYSWMMESGDYKEIESLPSDINIYKVVASVGDIKISDTESSKDFSEKIKNGESIISDEEQYIQEFITVEGYKVDMFEGYRGREEGIANIQVKNNGEKNIDRLTVTVFFQDENGKNIAENSIMVIGSLFGGDTLKANYSWKMEKDTYYKFENLADEVDISRNYVEVTKIEFEE